MGRIISRPREKTLGNLPFGFGLAACKRLQGEVLLVAVIEQVLQLVAEIVQVLLLFDGQILEHLVRYRIVGFGRNASGIVIAIDRTLFQLHRETEHLLGIGDLARRKRRIHIHVPLQEKDTVGQLLAMTHFGDGNHPHLFGKILVTGIFEMDMEIHVLERGGNLFSQSIVQ